VLKPASREATGECPDAAILAAMVEDSLTPAEQSALDAHIVSCGRCQETLAILSHELPGQEAEPIAPAETGWFTWVTRPKLRWLVPISAAATVAVVFFATRPLIAPEGDVPAAEVVQMAQAPSAPAEVPADELNARRERSAAIPGKNEFASAARRADDTKAQAGPAPAPRDTREAVADAALAGQLAPARKPVEAAAEMAPARMAPEDKRAQPAAPQAAVPPAEPGIAATGGAATQLPAADARRAAPPTAGGQTAVAQQAANVPVQEDAVRKEAAAERDRAARVAGGTPAKLVRSLEASPVTVREPGGAALWRVGAGGRVSRSVDGGVSWQPQASGVTADLLAGSAPSPTVCWVVGMSGTVLLTTDGQRWQRRPFPDNVDLVAVMATDVRSATVVTRDGRRFETPDGGRTWSLKQP
jgi:hypothetical protein